MFDKSECLILFFLTLAACGLFFTLAIDSSIYTKKHECEYVEKTECKQVWVKK